MFLQAAEKALKAAQYGVDADKIIPFAYNTHGFVAYLNSKSKWSLSVQLEKSSPDQNPEIDGALTSLSAPLNGHLKQL